MVRSHPACKLDSIIVMEERFKVGNILEDVVTKERFKVLKVEGDFPYAWVTMLHLRYELEYTNFANNLGGLVLT